jgi:ElaB/YqjD/DUF883 family membrane-anchored ribosome-binding protein
MDPKTGNNQQGNKPRAQGSGSDTVSAANLASGGAGQTAHPGQSATLASHTSKPMGGSQTGSGQSSQGPEHLRHQDKDAGKGLGDQARAGASQAADTARQAAQSAGETVRNAAGQAADTARQAAQSAGETVRDAAGQVQQRAADLYDRAAETAEETYEQASEWARGAYDQGARQFESVRRSLPDVRQYGGSVQRFVNENPVLVGVAGLAAGLLLGALLPRTRREDQVFGRWADEVRDQGLRYARDMTQRGREYVDEALGDDRFSSPDTDWRRDQRSGPSGRFQNH